MGTLAAFIERHRIGMTATHVSANPNIHPDEAWAATHYRCTLHRGGGKARRQMTVYFSQGSAHTRDPSVADVLDCLALDASSVDNARTFEEWASELGYDPDSRKAGRIYRVCERQAAKLRQFLGSAVYQELLWSTERE